MNQDVYSLKQAQQVFFTPNMVWQEFEQVILKTVLPTFTHISVDLKRTEVDLTG